MNASRRSNSPPAGSAGGRRSWRPAMVSLVIALALAAGVVIYLSFLSMSRKDVAKRGRDSTDIGSLFPESQSGTPQDLPEGIDPNGELTIEVLHQLGERTIPTMKEWIHRLQDAGVYTGIGAFNPPGTRPPLVGLAVPEDFVLPKGYVRHHQATDDGQRIEAILMFDPDYQPVDASNRPIALPKDRVVTPELAPAGLPIRRIVLPEPINPEGT